MKKILLGLLIFTIVTINSLGQNIMLPVNMMKSYLNSVPEDGIEDLDLTLYYSVENNGYYQFRLNYANLSDTFLLKPLSYFDFEQKLNKAIILIFKAKELSTKEPNDSLKKIYFPPLFTQIIVSERIEEEKPEVATVYLKDSIPLYIKTDIKDKNKNHNAKIHKHKKKKIKSFKQFFSKTIHKDGKQKDDDNYLIIGYLNDDVKVEIAFTNGYIQKIQVQGKITKKSPLLVLDNKFSIGISSSFNLSRINKIPLRSDEKFSAQQIRNFVSLSKLKNKKDIISQLDNDESTDKKYEIRAHIGDIIKYIKRIDINANDISPGPIKIELNKNQKEIKLFREETSKLFEAQIYSDLLGMLDEKSPNGIVQIEAEKKFNIFTKMTTWGNSRTGWGILQYYNMKFTYSKIESYGKFVSPIALSEDDPTNSFYYPPIKLLQHRNYSVGGVLNLFYAENQDKKINFNIDAGLNFGRTGVLKTQNDSSGYFTNCIEIPVELGLRLIPEKRVELSISDKTSYFKVLDPEINLNKQKYSIENYSNYLHTLKLGLNLKLNDSGNGRLFFRYKFIHDWSNWNYNFSQLQVGYSFYILKNNGIKNKIVPE